MIQQPHTSRLFPYTTLFRSFKMQFAADAICTRDALGEAFANATAQNDLQSSIDSGVADGSFSLVLAAIGDRKSTRLNSSHVEISYAVFCLKKNIHHQPDEDG